MNKLLAVLLTVAVVGCASPNPAPPVDVQLVPNDCANKSAIDRWLTQQANRPQQHLEREEDYARHRAAIRHRIWNLRYHCQPV